MQQPGTLGELKAHGYKGLSVKDELRANLIRKLKAGEKLFRGIVGYEETVLPQLVNAILARHNIILLGLRGQAKSRIIRQLTELLDEYVSHRLDREQKILQAVTDGATSPANIVAHVYTDVSPKAHDMAERAVLAHLEKLEAEGRVVRNAEWRPR